MSSLLEGIFPPSRETYEILLRSWQIGYPIIGSMQWIIKWYGMGKTSVASPFNIPGRVAWMTMESPGFLTLLYVMNTLPQKVGIEDLPWQNRVLGGLFVIHYSYRAILFPLLQPSMSPIHVGVWALAIGFQLCNALCLSSWLSAYGPVTPEAWASSSSLPQFIFGIGIFYLGLSSNFFHDEELREIRRREQKRQERIRAQQQQQQSSNNTNGGSGGGVEKHYQIPQAGLFRYVLYPHYLSEWIEWLGFYMAAGWGCAPARAFLVNEVFSMLPRAVNGKKWYAERFGEEKIRGKWAVIPGVL
ncbi:3-oxo-5-alpha-steroid 4-dehydrogenase [Trichoderma citrinoviride]|uniref:3-oxo-5-alpha-steroid 4-dehydrogenase n=1 Tax=Trichoderma citrinoviride TaxID=58853 RepID=A0A2T4B3A6_9HYPO|nr:3-oxo-5-alpha-steroid 4-dehydrogenase [Trichoderma citrinoviride]PTB63681.1 3-oxo-5-alpha-steroid 4-dehydrogenase [Trichoderma citrinoviride]